MPLFLLFFAAAPLFLAIAQDVPTRSDFQQWGLLVSLAAFGLMLGLFWLSRLMPKDAVNMKFSSTLRWHKYIGYAAGLVFLVHPLLMIARRFWAVESDPIYNLMLMLKSPLMLTGIMAWVLMIILVVLAFIRKIFSAKLFRYLHGMLSMAFTVLATWHVISVGRHSNLAMSVFWMVLAGGAVATLLLSYLKLFIKPTRGVAHESA